MVEGGQPIPQALEGVREKLHRAGRHTDDLDQMVVGFLEEALYTAVTERYVEEAEGVGHITVRAKQFSPHPVNAVGVVVGDIVHNLRSALDHLAWQLAMLAGNDPPPRGTEFAVFRDSDVFDREGRTKIRGLADEDRAVVEQNQPFNMRPDDPTADPLWVLHELANIDKHRVCPVTLPAVQWALHGESVFTDCELIREKQELGPFEDGAVIVRFDVRKTGPHPEVAMPLRFSYTAKWAEDGPCRGAPLFKGIDAMRSRVEGIVSVFAPRFG